MKEENKIRMEEIDLALGWVGNIKKDFQREQTRLIGHGVTIRLKPVWQSIHDTINLLQKRRKDLK